MFADDRVTIGCRVRQSKRNVPVVPVKRRATKPCKPSLLLVGQAVGREDRAPHSAFVCGCGRDREQFENRRISSFEQGYAMCGLKCWRQNACTATSDGQSPPILRDLRTQQISAISRKCRNVWSQKCTKQPSNAVGTRFEGSVNDCFWRLISFCVAPYVIDTRWTQYRCVTESNVVKCDLPHPL